MGPLYRGRQSSGRETRFRAWTIARVEPWPERPSVQFTGKSSIYCRRGSGGILLKGERAAAANAQGARSKIVLPVFVAIVNVLPKRESTGAGDFNTPEASVSGILRPH